jgi:Ca-activated chloride channel family protein
MSFANPLWFWALLVLPIYWGYLVFSVWLKHEPRLLFSDTSAFYGLPGNYKSWGVYFIPLLYSVALTLLVLSLARPQLKETTVEKNAEGIDIILVMDISTSMRAEDLKPNRFEAARQVAKDFISQRISDRIGLVVFARKSFTVCPPTLDYTLLNRLLDDVQMGLIEDGTAIGMGLATAINRLKDSEAKSKILVLLTDGENNSGEIDPVTAADLAVSFGIKVYTIGAGTRGTAPYPVQDPIFGKRYQNVPVDIDEDMLTEIASLTGGSYFRATDAEELKAVYAKIDELERTKVEELIYTDYTDLYPRFILPALLLLIIGLVLDKTYFRIDLA